MSNHSQNFEGISEYEAISGQLLNFQKIMFKLDIRLRNPFDNSFGIY